MAIEPVRVYEISTGAITDLNNNEICSEATNDSELGFPMWGGKDNSGNTTKWLAKDKNARINALTVLSYTTPGFLKNDASGVITGGNQVTIDDIADKYWLRNNALGYIYPRTLTDTVGVKVSVPLADLHVHGTFRVLTQPGGNIDEISNDTTMASAADDQLSTSLAIKTYVDNAVVAGSSHWSRADSFLGYDVVRPNNITDRVVIGSLNVDDDTGSLQINQLNSFSNDGISLFYTGTSMTAQIYLDDSDNLVFLMDYSNTALRCTPFGDIYLNDGTAVNYITDDVDMAPINSYSLATTYSIDSYVKQAARWDYSGNDIFPKTRDSTRVAIGPDVYSSYSLNVHHDSGYCIRISGSTTTPRQGGTLGFGGSPSFNYIKEATEDNLVIGFYNTCILYTTNAGINCLTADNVGRISLRYGGAVDEIGTSGSYNWSFADDDQLVSALSIKNYVDGQSGSSYWTRNTSGTNYLIPATRADVIVLDNNSIALGITSHSLNISSSTNECLRLCGASTESGGRINFGDSNYCYIEELQGTDNTMRIKASELFISRSTGSGVSNYSDAITVTNVSGFTAIGMGYGVNDSYYSDATVYMTKNTSGYGHILKLHNRSTSGSAGSYISMYTGSSSGTERMRVGYYCSSNVQSAGIQFDGYYFTLYCNEGSGFKPFRSNAHKVRIGDYDNLPSSINGVFELDGFSANGLCMDYLGTDTNIGTVAYTIECRIGSSGSYIQDGSFDKKFYIPIHEVAS